MDDKTELYTYDNQGNLTETKEDLPGGSYFIDYSYNGRNQLSSVNNNDEITSSYNYRYDGLRFSKTVDGSTKYFTYNGGNITSELTSQGTYNYYRGLSLIGMANPQQEKLYYVQNYKGDIIGLKDGIRNPVQSYSYDPFGNLATDTEKLSFEAMWAQETSQVYNPFGYCGEYQDEETGFVYLRGRYYDPATERLITEDPMKDGGNWYAYCGNDPVNNTDPSGCMYYTTQTDDLISGIAHGIGDSVLALLEAPTNLISLSKALYYREMTTDDLIQAGFEGLIEDYKYVLQNYKVLKARRKATNEEVYEMGTRIGSIVCDLATSPAKITQLISVLEKAGKGNRIIKAMKKIKGTSQTKRFALGIDDYGLDDFAAKNGAETYKNYDPEMWRNTVLDKLADPNTEVLVNLDGVDSPWAAVQRVARGGGGATDWELFQIKTNPDWWDSIKWFENGVEVPNPFK